MIKDQAAEGILLSGCACVRVIVIVY